MQLKRYLPGIIIAVVLIFGGGTALILWQSSHVQDARPTGPQTYTDTNYFFSFVYPPEWAVRSLNTRKTIVFPYDRRVDAESGMYAGEIIIRVVLRDAEPEGVTDTAVVLPINEYNSVKFELVNDTSSNRELLKKLVESYQQP